MVDKIVSGGQSGVDRAALDVGLLLGLAVAGWCPRGRRAEDGPIPDRYPLQETPTVDYPQRTAWNVRDSDGTLILARGRGPVKGGTALTQRLAREQGRPCLVADVNTRWDLERVLLWLKAHDIRALNVAGPRESEHPGIHAQTVAFLTDLLERARGGPPAQGRSGI